ncbi:MAG TPA: Rrf2 family transcriptional regulator [Capsulimonadaceae bacterium]|jgi:Rrf2 family protein
MISQTSEYALRAVIHLATYTDEPQTTQKIAAQTKVSVPYLSKVLQGLARAGIVHSQRGLHGGFELKNTLDELTVYDIVNAIEPIQRIEKCPLGLDNHKDHLCLLHMRVDEAIGALEKVFKETTIADVIATPSSSVPLDAQK